MDKLIAFLLVVAFGFLLLLVAAFIFAWFTQLAWAYSIAQIFHLPELTFNQAFWLNLFGGLVFKGSASVNK